MRSRIKPSKYEVTLFSKTPAHKPSPRSTDFTKVAIHKGHSFSRYHARVATNTPCSEHSKELIWLFITSGQRKGTSTDVRHHHRSIQPVPVSMQEHSPEARNASVPFLVSWTLIQDHTVGAMVIIPGIGIAR